MNCLQLVDNVTFLGEDLLLLIYRVALPHARRGLGSDQNQQIVRSEQLKVTLISY